MSAHIPVLRTPRSVRRMRCAGKAQNFRIASSRVSFFSSRTYLRKMRGKVPYARGCGCSWPKNPSGEVPEESLSIDTQGCCRAKDTSGSDIPNTATSVKAASSISTSKSASSGSLFCIFAIAASVLPCRGSSLGFCTTPMRIASGLGISCHSLSQVFEGVIMSLRMRARMAGSFKRSTSLPSPPSCAQGGMNAEKLLNHAV